MVKYVYDAWGNHTVSGSNTALGNLNPFRYRSYFYDTETKLYYLKTRYYDPEVGRFLNMDSVKYADPEAVNGLNLYAYCGNNPVMGYDPNGTWDWKILGAWAVIGVSALSLFAGIALSSTGVGAPLLNGGVTGLLGVGGSVLGQGFTKGWNNLDWGTVAIDGAAGLLTGFMIGSPLGGFKTGVAVGAISLLQSVGNDLYSSQGDFGRINWGKAITLGIVSGSIAGIGKSLIQNTSLKNRFINSLSGVSLAAEASNIMGMAGRAAYTNLWKQIMIAQSLYTKGISAISGFIRSALKLIINLFW